MICPNCGNPDVIVRYSRVIDGGRRRHRGCGKCNARWQTHEVMVDGTLDVQKPEPAWRSKARSLKRQGKTQDEIAAACGVSQPSVSLALRPAARRRVAEYTKEYRSGEAGRALRKIWREQEARV